MNGIDALNAGAVDFVTKGSNLGEAANKEVSGAKEYSTVNLFDFRGEKITLP